MQVANCVISTLERSERGGLWVYVQA